MPSTLTTSRPPLQIRPYESSDWPALWALLEPVFRVVATFPHDPASQAWVEQSQAVMVAVDPAGAVLSTYYIRPNSLALGALPGAFRHRQLGYVDALVMFQALMEGSAP